MDLLSTSLAKFKAEFDVEVERYFESCFGRERFQRLRSTLTIPPKTTSVRVNTLKATRQEAIRALQVALDEDNRRLVASDRTPFQVTESKLFPELITISSSPSKVPLDESSEGPKVVVDRLCGEAVLRGSDIFCCGVISTTPAIAAGDRVQVLVDIDGGFTRGTPFSQHHGRKIFIGYGMAAVPRTTMFTQQRGVGIKVTERVVADAPALNGILPDLIYPQNLPSLIAVYALDPQPGEAIIDLCAGPGGKTSHIGAFMQNQGLLVACDRSRRKAEEIASLCQRFGITNLVALSKDSRKLVLSRDFNGGIAVQPLELVARAQQLSLKPSQVLEIEGFCAETFDRVLLDPPCSALGLRPRLSHRDFSMANMQQLRNLFWTAVMLLKPGGILVYSTCTFNPGENEEMVKEALERYPIELVEITPKLAFHERSSFCGLSESELGLVQRFDPDGALDSIGFFIAKFRKYSSIRDPEAVERYHKGRAALDRGAG